jgi:MbtH protein
VLTRWRPDQHECPFFGVSSPATVVKEVGSVVDFVDEDVRFRVVVNSEEQYSIWPVDLPDAPGWRPTGVEGSREDCVAHIDEVWTDMRPLSLRVAMRNVDVAAGRVGEHG